MRQQTIPGTESKIPAAVRAAGDAYVNEAAKTAKAKHKADEAKAVLLAAMEKHEVTTFRDDEADPPVIISRTERHGIKVTKLKKAQETDGSENGDEPGED
jgi:hypothetical protein